MSFCLERPRLQQMLTTGQPLETLQRLIIGFWIGPFSIECYTITQPSLSFWGTNWSCKPRLVFLVGRMTPGRLVVQVVLEFSRRGCAYCAKQLPVLQDSRVRVKCVGSCFFSQTEKGEKWWGKLFAIRGWGSHIILLDPTFTPLSLGRINKITLKQKQGVTR